MTLNDLDNEQPTVPVSAEQAKGRGSLEAAQTNPVPTTFGRYRVVRLLGQGGFGHVYQAFDEQLERDVAIKVTSARNLSATTQAAVLAEARIVAGLDHPHIVPVFDVGQTDSQEFYIVSKLIDGSDLATRLKLNRPDRLLALRIVEAVADALDYAHSRGLVHRDVKPANILLDRQDRPYLADFGIALHESDLGKPDDSLGTPAYMSPEQARGEGHRVDNRSDIYSLGVVLYELLTGRTPFRSDKLHKMLELVASEDVRTPRLFDASISPELERICLKALARRSLDRFVVARDLSSEIRWLLTNQPPTPGRTPSLTQAAFDSGLQTPRTPSGSPALEAASQGTKTGPTEVIPRGLRAFDKNDASFFFDLLPGPFDRDGFPEQLRFWRSRIEEPDSERTFRIGVVYGPSGCGKSSLIKAGLLPSLSPKIVSIYLEATADDFENRLQQAIRKAIPDAEGKTLHEVLATIRRRKLVSTGGKLLLVIDQFEQWLANHQAFELEELTNALRQCDGAIVQAIILVRDDFWLASTRLLRELEVTPDAENSSVVDLFDLTHAEKVLSLFGRAYGKLPNSRQEWNSGEQEFLQEAVQGLATERKVIPVKLAIFAELMKSRDWSLESLRKMGGIKGVVQTFLEQTFSELSSPIRYRRHESAASGLLAALLPPGGAVIKGTMKSDLELQAASGYANNQQDFEELLRILDNDLRLITLAEAKPYEPLNLLPARSTDKESAAGDRASNEFKTDSELRNSANNLAQQKLNSSTNAQPSRHYQLTHDYLVPPLREWLSRKKRETRKGRAELKLEERAAYWESRKENKQLPSFGEWLSIRLLTSPSTWNPVERKLVKQADRFHLVRVFTLLTFITITTALLWSLNRYSTYQLRIREASNLVETLKSVEFDKLEGELAKVSGLQPLVEPLLRTALQNAANGSDEKLKLSLALLPSDPSQVASLIDSLATAKPEQLRTLLKQLAPVSEVVSGRLWENWRASPPSNLLPMACAQAAFSPRSSNWAELGPDVAKQLIGENVLRLSTWIELLRPVEEHLTPELVNVFISDSDIRPQSEIDRATEILESYAEDNFELLHELILTAKPEQFKRLLDEYTAFKEEAVTRLERELANPALAGEGASRAFQRRAIAAVVLTQFEQYPTVFRALTAETNLEPLSQFLYCIRDRGIETSKIAQGLQELLSLADPEEASQRREHFLRVYTFLLALCSTPPEALPSPQREAVTSQIVKLYGSHPSRMIHSAAGWTLNRWGEEEAVRKVDRTPLEYDSTGKREWFVLKVVPPAPKVTPEELSALGQPESTSPRLSAPIYFTMIVLPPGEFLMGDAGDKERRSINSPFAISDREVTWGQFSPYDEDLHRINWEQQFGRKLTPETPAFGMNWFEAVNYCRWLTAASGQPEDSQAFPPIELQPEQIPAEGFIELEDSFDWPMNPDKLGFRLLTDEEWEYAARSGTDTAFSFGDSQELLVDYGWYMKNSDDWSHPTGELRPSINGLFDMHGNVYEWIGEWFTQGNQRAIRGGSWGLVAENARSGHRSGDTASFRDGTIGFRIGMTLPAQAKD